MNKLKVWLQRKELGLPIWAWALIAAVVVFIFYRYLSGRNSSGNSAYDFVSQTDPNAGTGDPLPTGGGGGGSLDIPPPDASTAPYSDFPLGDSGYWGFDPTGYYSPADSPGSDFGTQTDPSLIDQPTITDTVQTESPTVGAHPSQGLNWGNQIFTDQASFRAWLINHGGNIAQFALLHPAAYSKYLSLPPGNPANAVKSPSSKRPTPSIITNLKTQIPAGQRQPGQIDPGRPVAVFKPAQQKVVYQTPVFHTEDKTNYNQPTGTTVARTKTGTVIHNPMTTVTQSGKPVGFGHAVD